MARDIALLGDGSNHGGSLITTNTDNSFSVGGVPVCGNGCTHRCPIVGHGDTSVTAITTRSYVNGVLVITSGASAGCGAIIQPPSRGVQVE